MCILLVEDELVILMATEEGIKDAGHKVMTAMSGPEAITHISHHPGVFSALVTDYNLPGGINGVDLVKYMRAVYPAIPMFITTATPQAVDEIDRHEYSLHVINKPYRITELVSMIEGRL